MRAPTNGDGTGRGARLSAALIGGAVAGAVCGVMVVFLGEHEAGPVAPGSAGSEALVRGVARQRSAAHSSQDHA